MDPSTRKWFGTSCGRTSTVENEHDARVNLDQYECTVPLGRSFKICSRYGNQTAHQEAV
jgi:hypothetical protein